jgi:hypothetical protein
MEVLDGGEGSAWRNSHLVDHRVVMCRKRDAAGPRKRGAGVLAISSATIGQRRSARVAKAAGIAGRVPIQGHARSTSFENDRRPVERVGSFRIQSRLRGSGRSERIRTFDPLNPIQAYSLFSTLRSFAGDAIPPYF